LSQTQTAIHQKKIGNFAKIFKHAFVQDSVNLSNSGDGTTADIKIKIILDGYNSDWKEFFFKFNKLLGFR
jgi:hypothetical protein